MPKLAARRNAVKTASRYKSKKKAKGKLYNPGTSQYAWTGNQFRNDASFSRPVRALMHTKYPYFCWTHRMMLEDPRATATARGCSVKGGHRQQCKGMWECILYDLVSLCI